MRKPMLLIVAHGSRRQASNDEVRALADQVRQMNHPDIGEVRVAFLELAEPSIAGGLAECAGLGAEEIVVFPYFLAAGTHVAADIPEEVAAFRANHPQVKVTLTPHLGAAPALPRAIVELALPAQAWSRPRMETLSLKLRGTQADGSEAYRSYFLVTDGGRNTGRGRASAIPMSRGAPMPEADFIVVRQGGEEEALARLLDTLLALPGNQGLSAELDDNPG